MKCYYHQEVDAVALCKSCNRALCPNCAADVPPGIACINRCEKDVEALNLVIERSKSAYKKAGTAHKRNAVAMLMVGCVFFIIGVIPIITSRNFGSSFMAVLGLVFLLWSYFSYRSGKQIESKEIA